MKRTELLLLGLAVGAPIVAYFGFGDVAAGVVVGALGFGAFVAVLIGPLGRSGSTARVRKVSSRATPTTVVGRAHRSTPALEAGAASLAPSPLRLTHDILAGMQTGGKTTRGMCSSCGATLWLSARRPLKARCPNCGHTRVLEH